MTLDDLKLRADLRAATRLTPREYDGPVWDHRLAEISDYEQGAFQDVGAMLARYGEDEEAPPAWTWTSKPVTFRIGTERAIRDQIDSAIDDGLIAECAAVLADDIAELQAALSAWSARMTELGRWGYEVDRSRVVVLDAARLSAFVDGTDESELPIVRGADDELDAHEAKLANAALLDCSAGPLDHGYDGGIVLTRGPGFTNGGGI